MGASMQNPLALLGRILLALLFIPAGVGKLTGYAGSVAYAASAGMPMPQVAVAVALLVESFAGLARLLGGHTRLAALALARFTLVASFFFHKFWALAPDQATMQQMLFFKNLAAVGGLLAFAAFGAGGYSVDARRPLVPAVR